MSTSNCHLYKCDGCPFYGPRVGSKGDPNSPIVIIGESPGKNEVAQKLPFVGVSGKLLHDAIDKYGIEPYFFNALQCFPGYAVDKKNEDRMKMAVKNCRHHVLDELLKAPRKMVIAMGAPALWTLTDNYDLKITQERGKLMESPFATIGMIPTVHPAFLLRGGTGATYQQFRRDLDYAFGLTLGTTTKKVPPKAHIRVAQSKDEVLEYAQVVKDVAYIASDIETEGFSPIDGYILSVGFAWNANDVFIVPQHLVKYANAVFDSPARFIWHNGKFDVKFLWRAGIKNARVDEDTMLLSYALDENGGIHDLEQVSTDWLDSPNWKGMLDQYLFDPKRGYSQIPPDVLHDYQGKDIANTFADFQILRPKVADDKHLEKLYTRTLIPASKFLAQVELNGLYVDSKKVEENEGIYAKRLEEHRAEINTWGAKFPDSGYTDKLAGSHQQKTRLIYDDLKIKPYKNQRTTDKKVLEKLPPHPFLQANDRYTKVAKEFGTYVKPLSPRFVKVYCVASDGRVHTTYKIHGTRTGRLSSSEPNVQNVPRNPVIRGQYVAAPGRRYVEVDLNQAELRLLATLSRDPELCKIYLTQGMSLHDEVRAELFGYAKDWDEKSVAFYLNKFSLRPEERFDEHGKDLIVAEQKMRAKNVNFGIPYGITNIGLAEQIDDTPQEAQKYINGWFTKFPKAGEFLNRCKDAPLKGQVMITNFGRKKRVGVVSNELLQAIQNESANFPMQGPASDCTLQSGIELEERLRDEFDATVNNLIHDALLIECPDDDDIAKQVARITIDKMEEVPKKWGYNVIPFVAEAKQGYRWGSLKEIKW